MGTHQDDLRLVHEALSKANIGSEDFGLFMSTATTLFDQERAIPVLIKLLPEVTNPRVKESIVRHLTDKRARPEAGPLLIAEFEGTPTEHASLKWAIGNALETVATNDELPTLMRLATDRSHGPARQMLVTRIGNGPKTDEIAQAIVSLLGDEDVTLHAIAALRRQLGNETARPYVEALLEHPSQLVQRQARQQLKRIDKALQKSNP